MRRASWPIVFVAAALVAVGVGLTIPYDSLVAPKMRLEVVDSSGAPVARACVSESYQNYSLEEQGHELETRTESQGIVHLPARTIRASAVARIAGPIRNIAENPVHSSFGPQNWVVLWAPWLEGDVGTFGAVGPSTNRVVMRADPNQERGVRERFPTRCSPPDV